MMTAEFRQKDCMRIRKFTPKEWRGRDVRSFQLYDKIGSAWGIYGCKYLVWVVYDYDKGLQQVITDPYGETVLTEF